MVRLVFRPYTQIRRSICTSESLRTSTRVSPGFVLFRHSSPSFGSQHVCSCSCASPAGSAPADGAARCVARFPPTRGRTALHFHCASRVCHPPTRTRVRLLGPCFKTGRLEPFIASVASGVSGAARAPPSASGAHALRKQSARFQQSRRTPPSLRKMRTRFSPHSRAPRSAMSLLSHRL